MWYGQRPPWMQRQLTPGAGMPPDGRAPMPMQRPQIPTPHVASSNVPLSARQGDTGAGALSPAMMGLLQQLFAGRSPQNMQKPAGGAPENMPNIAMPPAMGPMSPEAAQRGGGMDNGQGAIPGGFGLLAQLPFLLRRGGVTGGGMVGGGV